MPRPPQLHQPTMPQLPTSSDREYRYNYNQDSSFSTLRNVLTTKLAAVSDIIQQARTWYLEQSTIKQILLGGALVVIGVISVLMVIFHIHIIRFLIYLSDEWHNLKYGSLIIFALVFMVGFPPLIGFSALSFLTGMIYGCPQGWPLIASASVLGSTCSFIVYRYVLHNQAVKLMNHNDTFRAFAEILGEGNSLFLLILIRLCPLPYSLSNGALAAIPELPLLTYFLATLITSPKILIHLFVGSKLKQIGDDKSSGGTKIVDIISIVITGTAATLAAYLIYAKMQQKLASYHSRGIAADDVMVFGNFEDDLELGSNEIELNSADFDADNFIIEDDDNEDDPRQQGNTNNAKKDIGVLTSEEIL